MKPNIFKGMKFEVSEEDYSIIKSKKTIAGAFANIEDGIEITSIVKEPLNNKEYALEINSGWKIITFQAVLDFGLVGFISKIATALAKEKISIFVISSYSTDHVLLKKENLNKAVEILKKICK